MMKKFYYIVSILLLTNQFVAGQGFNLLDAQSINPGFVTDATYDGVSFIYVTGQYDPFDVSVDFDPGVGTSAVPQYGGSADIFIAKYDLNYNLIWVKGIGGDGDDFPNKIVVDAFGDVYVVGNFDGLVIDLDPDVGVQTINNAGGLGGFGVQLNSSGQYVSGYQVNDTGYDDISGIDFDASNNIYLTGTTGGAVFFLRTADFLSIEDYSSILGNSLTQYGKDIYVKSNGNFVINGIFQGTIDFDPVFNPAFATSTSAGSYDIFFAEYNATTGAYVSHGKIGGLGDDEITNTAFDAVADAIIMTGFFDDTANFNPAGTLNLSPVGGYDFFVAKYSSPSSLLWAYSAGGSNDDFSTGLDVNSAGQVYVTGSFQGIADFDASGGGFNLQSNDVEDAFLLTLGISGGFTNAMRLGDVDFDEGEAVIQAGLDIYLFAGFGSLNVDVDLNCSEFFLNDGYGLLTYEYVGMLDTEPADQPTNLTFNSITSNSFNGAFDAAASAPVGYLVLMSAKQLPDIDPVDGRDYCDNEILGTNGSGELIYAIFNDFQSFSIGMISPPEELFFKVYSFNGSGPSTNYLLTNPLAGSQAPNIGPEPTIQASNFMFQSGANTFQDLSWDRGNGTSGLIIVAKEGSAVDRVPTDGVSYSANDIFGLGDDLGGGNYVVYNGTGTTLTMNGLNPGTEYHLLGFEYNTTSGIENYLTSIQIPTFFTTTNLCGGDVTGPIVVNNTPTSVDLGDDINVSIEVTDTEGCPITEVKILYAAIDDLEPNNELFDEGIMTSASPGSSIYTFTISGKTNGLGVAFDIEATNQAQIPSYPSFEVGINVPANGYTIPYNSFGSAQSNYRIVSVPLSGANTAIEAVFDELGQYDRTKWRMYQYNGTTTSELSGSSTMSLGRGYWLIIKDNPGPITVGGGGTAGTPFTLNLNQGWNLIGNPYNFDIDWAEILAFNGGPSEVSPDLKVYRGSGAYENGIELEKFSGGFVLATGSTTLDIPAYRDPAIQGRRSNSNNSSRNKNNIDQPDWELLLNTKIGDLVNTFGGVGMNQEAQVDFDRYDELTLPRFLEYVEIVHNKPQKFNSNYTKDIVPTTENFTWDFVVESNVDDPLIELTWDNSYFGNNDKQLYLWDVALSKAVNMRTQTSYTFSRDISHDLKVIYGNQDYVKEKISVSELVFHNVSPNPVTTSALISFSVPEDVDQQTIEISALDLMGRKVWANSNQFQSGYHEVNWDIENKAIKGIYIVQIQSGNDLKHKRIVLK